MKQPDNPFLPEAISAYPTLYRKVVDDWQSTGADAAWLLYSANYQLRIGGTRLAIDPITLPARVGLPSPATLADDLAMAEVVMLSHDHSDHVNWSILSAIQSTVRQWIIPDWMQNQFVTQLGAVTGRVTFVHSGEVIKCGSIEIHIFEGNHWEDRPYSRDHQVVQKGLPSLAYLIAGGGKNWLFPGDTRNFSPNTRIPCGPVDTVAAHVFLGRLSRADDSPPLLDQFCDYFVGYQARRIVLSHLYELGRNTRDIWTENHAEALIERFRALSSSHQVQALVTGGKILW